MQLRLSEWFADVAAYLKTFSFLRLTKLASNASGSEGLVCLPTQLHQLPNNYNGATIDSSVEKVELVAVASTDH